jgi:predicted ATPase
MKIVLTGGPSAGKTALVGLIEKQFYKDVIAVPEAATILFRGGFPRQTEPAHVNHLQRAIYFLQVELEAIAEIGDTKKILICDRGTVDGAAYWAGPPEDFFKSLGTTLEKEIKRYDYVIHLETPNGHYYDHSNPVRTERPSEAHILDDKTKQIWATHSNRLIIHCHENFGEKVKEVLDFVAQKIEN